MSALFEVANLVDLLMSGHLRGLKPICCKEPIIFYLFFFPSSFRKRVCSCRKKNNLSTACCFELFNFIKFDFFFFT